MWCREVGRCRESCSDGGGGSGGGGVVERVSIWCEHKWC